MADEITLSRSAILLAIKAQLLESFPPSPYGEPSLSEWRASWIADQALTRMEVVPAA